MSDPSQHVVFLVGMLAQQGAVPGPIRAVLLFVLIAAALLAFLLFVLILMIHRRRTRRYAQERKLPSLKGPDAWTEAARRMK